jgi:hypothetical protein
MPFGQKPTFFFKLLKKIENLYIVIGDKKWAFGHSEFLARFGREGHRFLPCKISSDSV